MQSSLLEDLKQLKNCKPDVQPPRNKGRLERVMQFEEANGISLSAPNPRPKRTNRGGLFEGMTFCIPLLDLPNDPSPEKLVQLAKGICSQGGRLVEFSKKLVNRSAKYVLIDQRSDVGVVREILRERVLYVAILNYKWVEECLRKLARVQIAPYNLQRNYVATEASRMAIKKRLQEQKEANSIKNTIKEFESSSIDKRQVDKKEEERQEEEECDSDTVIMDECEAEINIKREDEYIRDDKDIQKEEIKIEQKEANCSQQQKEIKQQQNDVPKRQISDEQEFPQDASSKAYEWQHSAPPSDNESQTTEKMDSDDQAQPITHSSKKISKPKDGMSQLPQVTRRKTKLAIGSHHFSTNNLICEKLKQMQQIYEDTGNRKQYAYLRAIAAIRNYGKQIRSADQLKDIEGLGRKTIDKIREFLKTGSISKVEHHLNAKDAVPHKQLLRVHGIGLKTAEQLAHKGIKTLADLQANLTLLTPSQRLGLKYVDDFQQRIPRQKVARMLEFVKQTLFYVARSDVHHQVEAVGSFRRGRTTCGDIDILVTRRDGGVDRGLLQQLVNELKRRGFITDDITQPRPFDGRHAVHYMGVCRLQGGPHHRIDLKLYPADQYAFALLYFTGSDLFNRQMRMAACERGLILGDHGVRRQERNVGKPWRNSKIPACFTEKDVFELLGMDYRPPCQRQL